MPKMSVAELIDILEEEDEGSVNEKANKKKKKKSKIELPKFRKDRDLYI